MELIRQNMRSRLVQPLLALAALACASAPATASIGNAPVFPVTLTYQANGIVLVYFLNSVRSGTIPTCSANIGGIYYRLAFDSTTPGGKTLLAGLIAAHETGEKLWPDGTGDCGVDNANESLLRITTAD
jgi:hypothetical protein